MSDLARTEFDAPEAPIGDLGIYHMAGHFQLLTAAELPEDAAIHILDEGPTTWSRAVPLHAGSRPFLVMIPDGSDSDGQRWYRGVRRGEAIPWGHADVRFAMLCRRPS